MHRAKQDITYEEVKETSALMPTPRKLELKYISVIFFLYIHIAGIHGFYLAFTKAKLMTLIFSFIIFMISAGGVLGAHRLWTHKSFKATLPLEIFLLIGHTIACQYSAYYWVRDHRLHHKCSDTDGDPHNATRGFFFSHIGWLLVKKHPEVKIQGSTIDMEDIRTNPLLSFQKRHAKWLLPTLGFIMPTIIPVLLWNEDLSTAWHLNVVRYITLLHITFCINSVAHFWGYKPYDKNIRACQNLFLALIAGGEGFHNFHHTFPYDYRTSDKSNNKANLAAMFVDMCAKLGLAYDLREVSEEIIMKRKTRTGDGTDEWGYPQN